MSPQGIWHVMRACALARHHILHALLRDDWVEHERIIKYVYGY